MNNTNVNSSLSLATSSTNSSINNSKISELLRDDLSL